MIAEARRPLRQPFEQPAGSDGWLGLVTSANPRNNRRLYEDLAWTWPIISPPEEYVQEAEQARALILQHSRIPVKTLLHLGCGGGHLDLTLKKHFRVTGVDISNAMLGLARRLNPEVTYLEGDMRTVRLGRTFDAVTVFDSIDYMLTPDDLRAAFATAYTHLGAGGMFLTCAEVTLERFSQNRTEAMTRSAGGVEITFIENAWDPDPTDTTFENTFVYLIQRGGQLEIETDRHLSGLFPFQTWLDFLREAGFHAAAVHPPGPRQEGEDYPWFVCVKAL